MGTAKHTPGPWHAVLDAFDHGSGSIGYVEHDPFVIADVIAAEMPTAEAQANADLIAAAPDLKKSAYVLMVLAFQSQRYLEDREYHDAADAVFAAIAKAEGRIA